MDNFLWVLKFRWISPSHFLCMSVFMPACVCVFSSRIRFSACLSLNCVCKARCLDWKFPYSFINLGWVVYQKKSSSAGNFLEFFRDHDSPFLGVCHLLLIELQFSVGVEFENYYIQQWCKSGILSFNFFFFQWPIKHLIYSKSVVCVFTSILSQSFGYICYFLKRMILYFITLAEA